MAYKYKAKNGQVKFVVPGVGESDVNGFITSDAPIHSAALELVADGVQSQPVQATAQPQTAAPAAVIGVAPVATAPAPAPVAPQPQPINEEQN